MITFAVMMVRLMMMFMHLMIIASIWMFRSVAVLIMLTANTAATRGARRSRL